MHCPKCGQQQVSEETRFCSRCGFLLTGVAQVVNQDGLLPASGSTFFASGSPRRRGVMQGVFVFLLSFLIVPLAAIITIAFNWEPFLPAISAILFTVGGLLRVVYALMFESGTATGKALEAGLLASPHQLDQGNRSANQLPPAQSIPATAYAPPGTGRWRDTNELDTPGSVTDNTTKLLHQEPDQ